MTPLSKKEGAEVEVSGRQASGQMGVVIFSGQLLSAALNILRQPLVGVTIQRADVFYGRRLYA